jgi:hypothetical protein
MHLWEMHRALGHTGEIVRLFILMKDCAPQAEQKMNRLARKKLDRYALANGQIGKQ